MQISDIGIYSGKPDFDFTPIRKLEVKCEASNALMPAPTVEEANGRLRALAAKLGANAIVEVEYNSGVSLTSWKSLKATGVAGTRRSDEVTCAICAETIKRAATKCRYCGAERSLAVADAIASADAPPTSSNAATGQPTPRIDAIAQEPLRDNNNPALIIGLCVLGVFILSLIMASAG